MWEQACLEGCVFEYARFDRAVFDRYVAAVESVSPQSHPERFPTRNEALAYYLNAYNAGDSAADCNDDGNLNTQDVLCFLNLWNAGC